MQVSRFYSLDVCRGIAALTVAAGHFIIEGAYPINGVIEQAYEWSVIWNFSFIYAVDFFLVLSGFVLSHSYFHRMDISFRDFALRRFLRMYPLHLLTLLVTVAIFVAFQLPLGTKDFLLHFLFIHNMGLGPDLTLNTPAWTISVEFWINLGIFAVFLFARPKSVFGLLVMVLVSVMCLALIWWGTGHLNVNGEDYKRVLNSGLVRCLGSFLLGIVAYEVYRRWNGWKPGPVVIVLAVLLFLSIILFLPGHSVAGFVTPPLFAIIVLIIARGEQVTSGIGRRLAVLGDVSFSVYLVHHPLLRLFRETDLEKSVVTGIGFMLVTYCIAVLAFRYFEKPVYRWSLSKTAIFRAAKSAGAT